MKSLLIHTGLVGFTAAHATMKQLVIDGTTYRAFDARVDGFFPNLRTIEWSYNNPPVMGQGPVGNVTSPDITCQKDAKAPALRAKARAGAQVTFNWSPYFNQHKGPVMTYLGAHDSQAITPQQVKWFKIHEESYDEKTEIWGSNRLTSQNGTWTVQLPSDIKAGNYILRTELLALHLSGVAGIPLLAGGAQFYPTCFNIKIIGHGKAEPAGVLIPGAYAASDPGIGDSIYKDTIKYISPGPSVYKGEFKGPKGPVPVVAETGQVPKDQLPRYQTILRIMDVVSEWISSQGNKNLPAGLTPKIDEVELTKDFARLGKSLFNVIFAPPRPI